MLKKIIKIILWVAGLGLFVFVAFLIFANILILRRPHQVVSIADAPEAPVALVFGGGMKDATTMSDLQADRVKIGVELYKQGKVKKIMMTGDDGAYVSDEVDAMKKSRPVETLQLDDLVNHDKIRSESVFNCYI